jgi:hypothetical protein
MENNVEKEFVTYEQALALANIGYDVPAILTYFRIYGRFSFDGPAPLKSQVFRWFRKNHNWQHSIEATSDQHRFEIGYNYWIWNNKTGEEYHTMPKNVPKGDWEYETYEEAENACIDKLIEIQKVNGLWD